MPENVIILGAGASKPFGFPLGEQLRSLIVTQPAPVDPNGVHAENPHLTFCSATRSFVNQLAASPAGTIDYFLSMRPEFTEIGQRAIAFHILNRELRLFRELVSRHAHDDDPRPFSGDWHAPIVRSICARYANGEQLDLDVLTFNYDRCFEIALRYGLLALNLDPNRLIGGQVRIHHIHGSPLLPIELLEQMSRESAALSGSQIFEAARGIAVLTNQPQTNPRLAELLATASRVLILGFGFDRLNLTTLDLFSLPKTDRYIVGTMLGLPPSVCQYLARRAESFNLTLIQATASDLLQRHMPAGWIVGNIPPLTRPYPGEGIFPG